jgi:glycine cleavage system H protein
MPDELLYDVDNHIWFQEQDDGTVKVGMTAVATAMAGKLVAFTPKRVGRSVRAGKSCGTLESGKWVGPAKSAAAGEVVAVNDAMVADPSVANDDPYEAGWLIILKPDDWSSVVGTLTAGSDLTVPYEAKMDSEGFGGCA